MEKQKIDLKKYNGNLIINTAEAKIGTITLIYNLEKKSIYLAKILTKQKIKLFSMYWMLYKKHR